MTAATLAKHVSKKVTPQSEPIPGSAQVANSAGGFAFAVDDWTRLDRFLVLGSDGGSYYASEKKLTLENAKSVLACLKADGPRAVNRIVEISVAGRAPKNDPAIFALAMAASEGDEDTKRVAFAAIPSVCRIGTHLFQFAAAVNEQRGWGRGLRNAIAAWYLEKDAKDVAYQATKYQQRDGWAHRDLLRLSHPKAEGNTQTVLNWIVKGWPEVGAEPHPQKALLPIWAMEKAKRADTKAELVKLIAEYDLPRECIPTKWLTEPEVWEALLEKMPMNAMIRNLATMTKIGLLKPLASAVGKVVGELANGERLKKSRLHPVALLSSLLTYKAGRGVKSDATWTPVSQIVDALDGAFYAAFGNVEPTGKRWLLALDVSGSMGSGSIAGIAGLTPRVGSAAMALVTAATEKQHHFMGFSTTFVPLPISPRQRLDDVCNTITGLPFSGTDCALPMLYAMEKKLEVDCFTVYTDNETWAGRIHPVQALKQYRQKTGIPAKLIVVGMVSNGFTIADPNDGGMMDVAGFDTATPQIMSDFAKQ